MQRSSSCSWVKGLLEMFASRGLDVARLVEAAGIEARRVEDPEARFGADEVSRLWEVAVAWSGDPTLGMERSLAVRYVNFDVVGYAMLSSADLRSALLALARYLAVISDAATFELAAAPGGGAWLELGHIGNARPVPCQRFAYGMLALLTLCEWLLRRPVQPLGLEFRFDEPPERRAYDTVFRCPLRFGRGGNRMLLGAADLDTALPSRNPSLLALHEQVIQTRLAALGQPGMSFRVTTEIVRGLHRGEPRRQDIAASLAMTDRTLQRRLQAEGTSFQQLLEDTRRELACKYLADPRHSLNDVADLLGFGDPSNFFRACRRWFGLPPGQYRERLAPLAAPS